jgi:hypothetical protein
MPKKTFDIEIRERAERFCLELMADHPELEAVGLVFLSRHLRDVLAAMVVGADGPLLRPDQTVRLYEAYSRLGATLVANQQRDVQILDELLAQYARRLADAQAREAQAGEELSDRTPQA